MPAELKSGPSACHSLQPSCHVWSSPAWWDVRVCMPGGRGALWRCADGVTPNLVPPSSVQPLCWLCLGFKYFLVPSHFSLISRRWGLFSRLGWFGDKIHRSVLKTLMSYKVKGLYEAGNSWCALLPETWCHCSHPLNFCSEGEMLWLPVVTFIPIGKGLGAKGPRHRCYCASSWTLLSHHRSKNVDKNRQL